MDTSLFDSFKQQSLQQSLITPNDKILIGISGGPDSICLFYLMKQLSLEYPIQFGLAHVHYGLRGEESWNETQGVVALARDYRIPLHQKILCLFPGSNLQERARQIRFSFFQEIIDQYAYTKLALAHHSNDQVETFVMQLFRGSSLFGLIGMRKQSRYGRLNVIRPLLDSSQQQIKLYLDNQKYPYWIDSSNKSLVYLRNWIRNVLVPCVQQRIPRFQNYCLRSIKHLNDSADWIERQLQKIMNDLIVYQSDEEIQLDLQQWNQQDTFICKTILVRLARSLGEKWNYFDDAQLRDIHRRLSVFNGGGSQRILSKYDLDIIVEYSYLSLVRKQSVKAKLHQQIDLPLLKEKHTIHLHNHGSIEITQHSLMVTSDLSHRMVCLDELSLYPFFNLRFPKEGERVDICPKIGQQRLKFMLINWKVPRRLRYSQVCLIEHAQRVIGVIVLRSWKVRIHPDYLPKKNQSSRIYIRFN